MYQLILMVHVLIAVMIIGLVLIQHGKSADVGAALGSGASNTLFGSQGTGGILFKLTGGLALAFFATSLLLSFIMTNLYQKAGQQAIPAQEVPASQQQSMPVPLDDNGSN